MVSVSFQFRTWNANGLLLFSTLADGMLELVLKDGKVVVHISVLQVKGSRVDMASGTQGCSHLLLFYTAVLSGFPEIMPSVPLCGSANTQRQA